MDSIKTNTSEGEKYRIEVTGMSCDSCARHVKKALERVRGVEGVEVPGWKEGVAFVKVKPGEGGSGVEEELLKAVRRAGYGAELSEGGAIPPEMEKATGGGKNQYDSEGYDLMVIGGGSAGFAAAIRGNELGYRVAIVEESVIGGTCVNVGCVPSKILIKAVSEYYHARHPRFEAVKTGWSELSWGKLVEEKDGMVEHLRKAKYIDVLASYPEIDYIEGKAVLKGENWVEVNGAVYQPGKIIISTGAKTWVPPIEGLEECGYLTSTTAMELKELPASMLILGASAVGIELAQMFARAGVEVSLVEVAERIAPSMEPEISEELEKVLKSEGIRIFTGVRVRSVERRNKGRYFLYCTSGGSSAGGSGGDLAGEFMIEGDSLLVATGRRPVTGGMGLEEAGVRLGARGEIVVNRTLRSDNPYIYAAGDVLGKDMFVYTAAYSGSVASENALTGAELVYDTRILPGVIFSDPQAASVGLTEREAREAGYSVDTTVLPIGHVPIAIASRDRYGLVKVVADSGSGEILGVHILSDEAGSVVEIAAIAMKAGLRIEELKNTLFPYLTYAEGLKLAAITFKKDVAALSCCAV